MIAAGKGWRRDRAGGEALGYCLGPLQWFRVKIVRLAN